MRGMRARRGFGSAFFLALLCLTACGPNPYDLYLNAMRAQGAAERRTCKLKFNARSRTHVVNSGQIINCITELEDALELYEKAQRAGYEGKELDKAMLKINEDLRKLRSMQGMVSEMEGPR